MHEILDLIRPWAAAGAIGLTIPTTWIYFRKIRQGLAKPHVLTWVVLASITLSSSILQSAGGAGLSGALPLFFASTAGYTFAYMAWRRGYMGIVTRIDYTCIALAVIAWLVWLGADQPVLAVAALSIASVMAFLPTFRKSWSQPWDEPISRYSLSIGRYVLASIAVANYNFVTGFYPTLWIGVTSLLVILLILRRRYIRQPIRTVTSMRPVRPQTV